MPLSFTYLPYQETGYFSPLVIDYLTKQETVQPFYQYSPDIEGINKAIEDRKKSQVDRKLLCETLKKQYAGLSDTEAVMKNITLLGDKNTFTICTAHQPNLMTGYLYFIYKIAHAIKLAAELKKLQPEKNFVPVYYMGSEDNDLDELGTFRYEDKKFVWDANGQTGAVGRMDTASLKPLLEDLYKLLGPPGEHLEALTDMIGQAYQDQPNISAATCHLVHRLFGEYGLVVLEPDEPAFKRSILHIIKDDLLHNTPNTIATATIESLSEQYKAQAQPRPINLFYLKDNIRERIEKKEARWHVLHTDISWSEGELMAELDTHPERFSPNVILRGLFQETILPNVAFIGGGAEVAYWLQLKDLFKHYNVFYPAILLRQSVMWIDERAAKLRGQLSLSVTELFANELELVKNYIKANGSGTWETKEQAEAIETALQQLKQKAVQLDPTLASSAEAALTKIKYQLLVLEKKMYRAEKRKTQAELAKISRLKAALFPNNSLQERYENFLPYYLKHGKQFISTLNEGIRPLDAHFLVIEESSR